LFQIVGSFLTFTFHKVGIDTFKVLWTFNDQFITRSLLSLWVKKTLKIGRQNIKKFPLFGKESPHRDDSLDRFLKILGDFIRLPILHQRFKFHVIRITGY